MSTITIASASEHLDQEVTVRGWLYNKRSSGKIQFLQVRDGTGVIQAVLSKADNESLFNLADGIARESSIVVTGLVCEDKRAPSGCELQLRNLEVVSEAVQDFPIELKEQTPGFLMDHRHLWVRTGRQVPILRVRDAVFRAFRRFFEERDFIATEAPILTGTSVEGTTTLFELDYYGAPAYLGQSGQLYLEATCMALGKTYWIGPAFRAEKSKTRKHVTEFWIAEAEAAFVEHAENLQLQEDLVRFIVESVTDERAAELSQLERDIDLLKGQVAEPFPRVDYADAISLLQEKGFELSFGDDFGAPEEEALGAEYGKPVFIERMPASMKPFYMKRDPNDRTRALAADLIAPEGFGEIIGGSQREHRLEILQQRMVEQNLNPDDYWWYLDLRRYGTVPHAGFGLGLERTIQFVTGMSNIRDVIPFPRTPGNAEF